MSNPDNNERFKDTTEVLVKTLAGRADLEVNYSNAVIPGTDIFAASNQVTLPMPDHNLDATSVTIVRGCADAQGLYRQHHNPSIHAQNIPNSYKSRAAFNALENLRCESLGATRFQGIAKNIAASLEEKCRKMGYASTAQNASAMPPHDAMHLYGYFTLTHQEIPETLYQALGAHQNWLDKIDWQALQNALPDQEAFADLSRSLINEWITGETDEEELNTQSDIEQDDDSDQEEEQTAPDPQQADENDHPGEEQENTGDSAEGADMGEGEPSDGQDDNAQAQNGPAQHLAPLTEGTMRGLYKIYTTRFDEIIPAEDLADPLELSRLRTMLDNQLEGSRTLVAKLANRLQRKIMARQERRWRFDMEEGKLDASRLARMIANPSLPLTFKQEIQSDERDTVVSLLIDNSGSMRGRPIALAAMSADIIAQTLERCNVRVEILGFTTKAWKGGQSRDLWLEQGRPENPGRLNDIRHIIYKSADAPMRRCRRNLGLMLKEGILKENIDGEALAWAYNRLARRAEARKILMVISDGAPVDDSTLSVNKGNILEDDLRGVIHWLENHSNIELTAIGIGHDVNRYYRQAITLSDATTLAEGLISQLYELFETR